MKMDNHLLRFDVFPLANKFDFDESIFPVMTELNLENETRKTGKVTYQFKGIREEGSFDFGELTPFIEKLDEHTRSRFKEKIEQAVFQKIIEQTAAKSRRERQAKEKAVLLRPLEEWICDTCGQKMTNTEAAVTWYKINNQDDLSDTPRSIHQGFRIAHDTPSCKAPGDGPAPLQPVDAILSLSDIQSPNLISHLVILLEEKQCAYSQELLEIIKRVHLPYYEEGRLYLDSAAEAGIHPDETETTYHPHYLKSLIKTFKKKNELLESS